MPSPIEDTYKREAIMAVLGRLGAECSDAIRLALNTQYQINLDNQETYTLAKLHGALAVILGDYAAAMIAREIGEEIRLLSLAQLH